MQRNAVYNLTLPIFLEAQLLNCQPPSRIKFEKLIGIRPDPTAKSTLLYRSINNSPATLECISHCAYTQNCTGFLLFYNSSTCYSYVEPNLGTENYDYDSKPDTNVVWFRKTCLNGNAYQLALVIYSKSILWLLTYVSIICNIYALFLHTRFIVNVITFYKSLSQIF